MHDLAFGDRNAAGLQQPLGQILVARDAFGDRAGLVGLGGPDPSLARTVTELNQIAFIESDGGDFARGGGIDDAGRARAEVAVIDEIAQLGERRGEIEGPVFDRGQHQFAGGREGCPTDVFVAGPEDDLVDAFFGRAAGLAEAGRHPGLVLQLDRDVLENVTNPGSFPEPFNEAAALADSAAMLDQPRQPGRQPIREAGQGVRRRFLESADIHPGFDDRTIGPDVRSAQVRDP